MYVFGLWEDWAVSSQQTSHPMCLTHSENLVFADLQWFNFSLCSSDVKVYSGVRLYIVRSLFLCGLRCNRSPVYFFCWLLLSEVHPVTGHSGYQRNLTGLWQTHRSKNTDLSAVWQKIYKPVLDTTWTEVLVGNCAFILCLYITLNIQIGVWKLQPKSISACHFGFHSALF